MDQRHFVRPKFIAGISCQDDVRAAQNVPSPRFAEIREINDFRNIADDLCNDCPLCISGLET
jgi:hypothetical protein